MIKRILLALALAGSFVVGRAAVLPAEKILPKDTALVLTAPDWPKAWAFFTNTSYGHLWQDPAMRAFKDKFLDKFKTEALEPLQQSMGIKFSDYTNLAQGEAIFALMPITEKDNPDQHFAKILIIDSKDQAPQLKTNLASINKKWIDAGKDIKTQKIRETESPSTSYFQSPSPRRLTMNPASSRRKIPKSLLAKSIRYCSFPIQPLPSRRFSRCSKEDCLRLWPTSRHFKRISMLACVARRFIVGSM
jgi:hypothetical protein